jgi:hypothetical protein
MAEEELKEKQIHDAIQSKTEDGSSTASTPPSNENPIVN